MDRNFNINFESPLASSGQSGFIAGGALANVPVSTPKGTSEGGVCVTGLCSLVFICDKELPTKYCGGQIGGEGGSKMCIKQKDKCDVQCHKKLKAPFVKHRHLASGQYVLMGVGLQQDQAYLSHIVPVECFKADLATYANEKRTVDNWDMFFRAIKQGVLIAKFIGVDCFRVEDIVPETVRLAQLSFTDRRIAVGVISQIEGTKATGLEALSEASEKHPIVGRAPATQNPEGSFIP